jgi:hypothetical protein
LEAEESIKASTIGTTSKPISSSKKIEPISTKDVKLDMMQENDM